jgi:hypothetical protein
VDLLRAAIAPTAVVSWWLMVTPVGEAAAAEAPHTEVAGEPVAEAITEAEATQTATSPVSHAAAAMPAAELKKFNARSPPRQARMMASPPSLLDFATYFSQKSSNL